MAEKNLKPRDHVARWARSDRKGMLTSSFNAQPRAVNMKSRGAVDDLRALLMNVGAPDETMSRALDESETGETVAVFTVSNEAVDSYRTTFKPDGWDLDAFVRNPVVLFAHDRSDLPIGKDVGAWVRSGKDAALLGVTRFTGPDLNPKGHTVGAMVRAGFLNAVSVGFEPLEYEVNEERDDGESFWVPLDFIKQRLLEYSVVPVPANPEALLEGRSLAEVLRAEDIDPRPLIEWCERALDSGKLGATGPMSIPRMMAMRAAVAPVQVGNGLILGPSSLLTRSDATPETARADDVAPGGEAPADDDTVDESEVLMCPACEYEAPVGEFRKEPVPTEEEVRALDQTPTAVLLAQLAQRGVSLDSAGAGQVDPEEDEVPESDLKAIGEFAARTAAREVERAILERTGRLPGSGA